MKSWRGVLVAGVLLLLASISLASTSPSNKLTASAETSKTGANFNNIEPHPKREYGIGKLSYL